MYNGIGLRTPRGSGTSGYVQKNLTFIKKKNQAEFKYDDVPPKKHKPGKDVVLHRLKREIEVECMELREFLEKEKRLSPAEIEDQVDLRRTELDRKLQRTLNEMNDERLLAEQKDKKMARLKDAFGLDDDFKEGRGFNFETEKKRQERLARIAEEEKLRKHKMKYSQ